MHHHLEWYAYTNRLRSLPPAQKVLFSLSALGFALFAHPLVQGLLWLWLILWILGYARIPWRVYALLLGTIMAFWFLSLPALVVQILPNRVLELWASAPLAQLSFGGWSLAVNSESLKQAFTTGLRTAVCSTALLFLVLTTPFPSLLALAARWRVPSFVLEILMLMYRYLFTLLETALTLQLAQRARGGYLRRSHWLLSVSLLAAQLLRQSLYRYQQIHLALLSRGFQGQFRVLRPQSYSYSQRYGLEILVGGSALLVLNTIVA
ncbi:MAG: cobalt ECF transporter T component CbiQ [Thermosynechococcus sp.]|uniref:cobalt ECF transporter T component CbiQ n=1 Tax=Thermosynechococcus sp. TaxID=2814275 RepID=UPI00391C8D18